MKGPSRVNLGSCFDFEIYSRSAFLGLVTALDPENLMIIGLFYFYLFIEMKSVYS
jgi:hypothetical protein